jgi:hypothetical protein
MFPFNGFRPENIFWENNAPDDQFKVEVDYYEYISQGADFLSKFICPEFQNNTLAARRMVIESRLLLSLKTDPVFLLTCIGECIQSCKIFYFEATGSILLNKWSIVSSSVNTFLCAGY